MSSDDDAILRPEQARYLQRLLPPRDAIAAEIELRSAATDVPSSRPEVGRLLEAVAAIEPAGRVLEIGTGIGYGALHLARGAREGRVISIDVDAERQREARGYLDRAGVGDRVELLTGPALELLPDLEGPFSLVFLDALKGEYRRQLDLALDKMPVGGRVLVDNLLWRGSIADPALRPEEGDANAEAIERFNPYLIIHPQLASVILPLGDGVGLAVKRRPTIRDLGGPY